MRTTVSSIFIKTWNIFETHNCYDNRYNTEYQWLLTHWWYFEFFRMRKFQKWICFQSNIRGIYWASYNGRGHCEHHCIMEILSIFSNRHKTMFYKSLFSTQHTILKRQHPSHSSNILNSLSWSIWMQLKFLLTTPMKLKYW